VQTCEAGDYLLGLIVMPSFHFPFHQDFILFGDTAVIAHHSADELTLIL
jgi:hypothetical protein